MNVLLKFAFDLENQRVVRSFLSLSVPSPGSRVELEFPSRIIEGIVGEAKSERWLFRGDDESRDDPSVFAPEVFVYLKEVKVGYSQDVELG